MTIGVELAAKPELLLFLDEPTSGLDSDTAWSVCTLLRKLADQGQSILCTIHQPSGILFGMFDRLLLLSEGRSLYFGDIGPQSRSVIRYFERGGARLCGDNENPAEWLLEATMGSDIDWASLWQTSDERRGISENLEGMKRALTEPLLKSHEFDTSGEFATHFFRQLSIVTRRTIENDWRTPAYLYSKFFLILGMASLETRQVLTKVR